ncbi:MAG: hypothetical protein LBV47_06775 [Bacteroidales bacterium]|jgi:hypothetical protein|nr:hypothetical protein [Bacteroidales bacterium]
MKNTVVLEILLLSGVILFTFSCKPNCDINIPKGVNPIDWRNNNDVYTVYWNCIKDCSEVNEIEICGCYESLKNIKISGWINQASVVLYDTPVDPCDFTIMDMKEYIFEWNGAVGCRIPVKISSCSDNYNYDSIADSLRMKFDTTDITKKCYISGKLRYNTMPTNYCCRTGASIEIYSADDIYFE